MASSNSAPLTVWQARVLARFASSSSSPDFFLSGGAALAGFHLHHRPTIDLDLFTTRADAIGSGLSTLREVASDLNATLLIRQQAPTFVRAVVDAGVDGAVVVDLVHDAVVQLHADKLLIDGVRVDPLDEILANKLTALVGRQEERDLVDVWFIERAGLRVEDLLAAAYAKDGGCTPATLAWLLATFPLPPDARLPAGLDAVTLSAWRDQLVDRMTRRAHDDAAPVR